MKYLGIIDSGIPNNPRDGEIRVDTSNLDPILQIWSESRWKDINNLKLPGRAVRCSDLVFELRKRDWNIGSRRFISDSGELLICSDDNTYRNPVPELSEELVNYYIKVDTEWTDSDLSIFNENYEKLMSSTKQIIDISGKEVDFSNEYFNTLLSSLDLVSKRTTLDLIRLGSMEYKNIINLNGLLHLDIEGQVESCSGYIRMGIDYSVSGEVFTKNINFIAFDYKDGNQESDFLIEDPDFTLEYLDNCIRVFPKHDSISECIISYCYLTYEKLL